MRRAVLALLLFCAIAVNACDDGGAGSSPTDTSSASVGAETTSFVTEDGITLQGRLFGTGTAGIILAHMYPADQTSWYPAAERLAREGYKVLTFDFRGYGQSEGEKDIASLDKDMLAAITMLAQSGAGDMVLIGASMGGTASLVAAERTQILSSLRVLGVVTLSAPVEFRGLSAADAVPRLIMPLLFITAEHDAGAAGAATLQELAGDTGEGRILPGGEHGTQLLGGPAADEVWNLLMGFLQRNLPVTAH